MRLKLHRSSTSALKFPEQYGKRYILFPEIISLELPEASFIMWLFEKEVSRVKSKESKAKRWSGTQSPDDIFGALGSRHARS